MAVVQVLGCSRELQGTRTAIRSITVIKERYKNAYRAARGRGNVVRFYNRIRCECVSTGREISSFRCEIAVFEWFRI